MRREVSNFRYDLGVKGQGKIYLKPCLYWLLTLATFTCLSGGGGFMFSQMAASGVLMATIVSDC